MKTRNLAVQLLLFSVILTLIAVFVSGCQTIAEDWIAEDWSNVPDKREPEVNLVQYVHSVSFALGSTKMEPQERARLDGFLGQSRVGRTTELFLVAPQHQMKADTRRRDTVSAYLKHHRLHPQPASTEFGIEPPAAGSISVVARQYVVTLPGCSDWSDRPGITANNTVSRNWGCATATNLGLMVASPSDLAYGRKPGPMDGEAAVLAIQRYRAGETRAINPEDVGVTQNAQKKSSGSGGEGD
ncbi:MAG: hypothetical protein HN403_12710 [Rhodospirillales bacterium]|jgi:pilus assembly protein CpaD|nr:hypothetical protein [Rhodospirillales bacterium]